MKKSCFERYIALGLLPVLLSGCAVGPDYKRPKLDLPKSVTTAFDTEVEKFLSEKWWKVFGDSTLNLLEETALKKNADIRRAIAAIEEACAAAGIAASDFFPSIGLKYSAMNAGQSANLHGVAASKETKPISANVEASYEIDFWGKYRRANEAAKARLLATTAARQSILLTVTSEVAKTYFAIRALDAKLAITRRTLKTREESYRVYKSRFESGYCTELDYLRVTSEMESVRSTVFDLEAAYEKAENTLSALIGVSPRIMIQRKTDRASSLEKLRIPADIPSGLPSNLLERRPDVAQAEQQLIAANAAIGQALSENFPSFSLTGLFGFESLKLGSLFKTGSEMHSYGIGVSLPIFTGGKLAYSGKVAKAQYKQMLAAYENTVNNAFKETLDALISNRKNREIVISRTRQVNALKRGYEVAKIQKESGLIGLIDLLDVERGLLSAEMELAGALQNQLDAVVDICKSLGGGWKVEQKSKTCKKKSKKKNIKVDPIQKFQRRSTTA